MEYFGGHLRFGIHFLQVPVLPLQLFELGHQRCVHAAELAAPPVKRRRTDSVLATQFRHGRAGLGLLDHGDDLAVGETGGFMELPRERVREKFHFWRQLIYGGIASAGLHARRTLVAEQHNPHKREAPC